MQATEIDIHACKSLTTSHPLDASDRPPTSLLESGSSFFNVNAGRAERRSVCGRPLGLLAFYLARFFFQRLEVKRSNTPRNASIITSESCYQFRRSFSALISPCTLYTIGCNVGLPSFKHRIRCRAVWQNGGEQEAEAGSWS